MTPSALVWFEIPVSDMQRAQKFYGTLCGVTFESFNESYCFFVGLNGNAKGLLFLRKGDAPTGVYPRLCFSTDDCGLIEKATANLGGLVNIPKTKVSDEIGWFCEVTDSEGNRVSFHSMN